MLKSAYKKIKNALKKSAACGWIIRNGAMTLHEVADRLNMSYVRVKQIQDEAIAKIDKEEVRNELFVLEDGFF